MKKTLILASLLAVVVSCCRVGGTINVIPYPNSVEMKCGNFAAGMS